MPIVGEGNRREEKEVKAEEQKKQRQWRNVRQPVEAEAGLVAVNQPVCGVVHGVEGSDDQDGVEENEFPGMFYLYFLYYLF